MYKKINKKEKKLYIFIKQMSFVNKKFFFINKRHLFYKNIQILWIIYEENVSRPHDVDVALLQGLFFYVNSKYIYKCICNATYRSISL
jgi:hypothetical protein